MVHLAFFLRLAISLARSSALGRIFGRLVCGIPEVEKLIRSHWVGINLEGHGPEDLLGRS